MSDSSEIARIRTKTLRLEQKTSTISSDGTNIEINGTASVKSLNVSSSTDYGFIEVGGPLGGYIDLKRPYSDDYDLRVFSFGVPTAGGIIENYGAQAFIALSSSNIGVGPSSHPARRPTL